MFSETHSDSQRADRILASIRREESRPGRGLLKIFFGMAPGVGKTYAMLEAAIQAAGKGVQVMIGVAESHGREDTMRLIGRLPRLPMKKMAYRGVQMEEFDLEEALRVKPQLHSGGRAGAYERSRNASQEALPGCGGFAGRRDRRLHHAERAASGKPFRYRS